MIGPPGSTLWLLGHEMRLGWRTLGARRGRSRVPPVVWTIVLLLLIAGAAGVPLGFALRRWEIPMGPVAIVVALTATAMAFTLMLSQTLASATEALYQRGDLDLLFSSPVHPRKVMTVRFLGLALKVFTAFGFFLGPVLIPVAILGHPEWLGAIGLLAALALAATAVGLVLAMALFRLIGPRRTRTVAQVLAALIGAGFFLAAQAQNLMGRGQARSVWGRVIDYAVAEGDRLPAAAAWPLRAALGEPFPIAAVIVVGGVMFLVVNWWLGGRFAANSAAAEGAATACAKPVSNAPFAGGAFAATLRKELRLLTRDAALLSQVFLRVLYLLPVAFIVLRNAGAGAALALPAGAAALAFMAGQVTGSLSWITVSAEDAPDLLASAPAGISTIRNGKLAAALIPVGAVMAVPLAILIALAPAAGIAATAGSAAAALSAGLINIWHARPSRRSEFRRRRGGTWYAVLAEFLVCALIAGAVWLAAMGSAWALGPLVLAAILMLVLRRSDAQIAASLRAAAVAAS